MPRLRIDLRRIVAVVLVTIAALLVGLTVLLTIAVQDTYGAGHEVVPIAVVVGVFVVAMTYGGWRLWHHG